MSDPSSRFPAKNFENKPKRKDSTLPSLLAALLELTIGAAAAVLIIYVYFRDYYLPLSFLVLAVLAIIAYVILMKRVNI